MNRRYDYGYLIPLRRARGPLILAAVCGALTLASGLGLGLDPLAALALTAVIGGITYDRARQP